MKQASYIGLINFPTKQVKTVFLRELTATTINDILLSKVMQPFDVLKSSTFIYQLIKFKLLIIIDLFSGNLLLMVKFIFNGFMCIFMHKFTARKSFALIRILVNIFMKRVPQ